MWGKGRAWSSVLDLLLWTRSSNFSSCSIMLFDWDQSITLSRSFCRISWSSQQSIWREILVSSAKKRTVDDPVVFSRSLMKIMKRTGPRTVPCGTQLMTGLGLEFSPSTTIICCLSLRKESIHLTILLLNLYSFIFVISRLWSTLSKAFA